MFVIFFLYEVFKFMISHIFGVYGTFGAFTHNNIMAVFTNMTLLQSVNLHDEATFNGPSWSIAVEFYTYLFFGLSLICFTRYKKWYKWFIGLVIVSSAVFLLEVVGHLSVSIDFGFIRCLLGFYCGIMIYKIYFRTCRLKSKWISRSSIWSIIEFLILGIFLAILVSKSEIDKTDFIVFFINALLILVLIFSEGIVSRILVNRYLLFLGKISYSLYMCHYLFSSIIKNLLKYVYKSEFVIDSWGGFIEVPQSAANIAVVGYISMSILAAKFLHVQIENRFRIVNSIIVRNS